MAGDSNRLASARIEKPPWLYIILVLGGFFAFVWKIWWLVWLAWISATPMTPDELQTVQPLANVALTEVLVSLAVTVFAAAVLCRGWRKRRAHRFW